MANVIKLLIIGALLSNILSNEKIRKFLFGCISYIIINNICHIVYDGIRLIFVYRDKKFGSNAGLDSINPGLDLVNLDLDLGLGVLKVWAWTGLGPENQAQVQVGLQDLAKLLIPDGSVCT